MVLVNGSHAKCVAFLLLKIQMMMQCTARVKGPGTGWALISGMQISRNGMLVATATAINSYRFIFHR
jgi:hypothetical protein